MGVDTIEFNIKDKITYCPFYVTKYSKRYEGEILEFNKDKSRALCQLGFGKKWCLVSDLVKI